MEKIPFCIEEDAIQNILRELKAIDCINVSDCLIIEKIKAYYDGLIGKKPKMVCFSNDLRIQKFNIYRNLSHDSSSFLLSEFYEKRFQYNIVNTECAWPIVCNRHQEEKFWLKKSHMVAQRTSLGFPLVHATTNKTQDITHLYFQKHKPLPNSQQVDKYSTFQKLIVLYELKKSSMIPNELCWDYLDNYVNYDLTIKFRDALFLLHNPTKIIILSPRVTLLQDNADDETYLSLLSVEEREELIGTETFDNCSIVELLFKKYYTFLQSDSIMFRNEDIFINASCEEQPEVGRVYGHNKSMGFVINVSQTCCDMILFTEPNNKNKYNVFLKTITDFSELRPTRRQLPLITPYISI